MKKSALLLSALITVSSVAPVVAMQQQSPWSRFFSNGFLAMRDNFKAGLKHVSKLRNDLSGVKEAVDTVVGDNKKDGQNNPTSMFNGMAQDIRNDLRGANIPEAEKIVNDDSMRLIKLGMIGVGAYMLVRLVFNTFPKQQVQPEPRPRRRRVARTVGSRRRRR